MLIGTIRRAETIAINVEAHSLAEVHRELREVQPDGFEFVTASARMSNGTTLLNAAGQFSCRDGATEIEAADIAAMRAAVPEGWTLLHVRSA